MRKIGFKVEIHPDTDIDSGKTPDFKLTKDDKEAVFLEATLITAESQADVAKEARLNQLYEVINQIH